jgi:hypothetical protein
MRVTEIENKIKEADQINHTLKSEIDSMKIVQKNQTSALQTTEMTDLQVTKLRELEQHLEVAKTNTKKLEEDYAGLMKESEKKHKAIISYKEKIKAINEKLNPHKKPEVEEMIKKADTKEETIAQLKEKLENLEKYKQSKKKAFEKEIENYTKQIEEGDRLCKLKQNVSHIISKLRRI